MSISLQAHIKNWYLTFDRCKMIKMRVDSIVFDLSIELWPQLFGYVLFTNPPSSNRPFRLPQYMVTKWISLSSFPFSFHKSKGKPSLTWTSVNYTTWGLLLRRHGLMEKAFVSSHMAWQTVLTKTKQKRPGFGYLNTLAAHLENRKSGNSRIKGFETLVTLSCHETGQIKT